MLYIAENKRKFIEMVNRLFQSSSRDKRVCSRRRTWKFEAFLFKFQSVQLGPVSRGSQIDQSQSENGLAMWYLTIIPQVRFGYEMVDNERGAYCRVGYNHLISNKRGWNNCFIKNAHKISRILPDFICKSNQIQVSFNFGQTRTVTIFGEHGIMADIPWWLKPVRNLELHYPMIQFLIIWVVNILHG